MERKKIKKIKFFKKGHRRFIFTGILNKRKVAIKAKNPKSTSVWRIPNEIKIFKVLKKKKIGPKLLFCYKDFFVYEFIEGDFIVNHC